MPPVTNLSREGFGDSSSPDPDLPAAGRGFLMGRKMEQGLVQVYTGPGKGKTTAATGLLVRALGQGMRVLLVRFLKPQTPLSGEIAFLQGRRADLEILTSGVGVVHGRPDPHKVRCSIAQTFAEARDKILGGEFDLAVLDEINNALHRGDLPLEAVMDLIDERPAGTELVLTGRNAPRAVLERADLVTRLEADKHPAKRGIGARRGIEY